MTTETATDTDTATAQKPPSLRDNHSCCKRLEISLPRFAESSEVAAGYAGGSSGWTY
jgi:hypothetical protein